jgi:hypothetical protein
VVGRKESKTHPSSFYKTLGKQQVRQKKEMREERERRDLGMMEGEL